jgi:hypothetical protein
MGQSGGIQRNARDFSLGAAFASAGGGTVMDHCHSAAVANGAAADVASVRAANAKKSEEAAGAWLV